MAFLPYSVLTIQPGPWSSVHRCGRSVSVKYEVSCSCSRSARGLHMHHHQFPYSEETEAARQQASAEENSDRRRKCHLPLRLARPITPLVRIPRPSHRLCAMHCIRQKPDQRGDQVESATCGRLASPVCCSRAHLGFTSQPSSRDMRTGSSRSLRKEFCASCCRGSPCRAAGRLSFKSRFSPGDVHCPALSDLPSLLLRLASPFPSSRCRRRPSIMTNTVPSVLAFSPRGRTPGDSLL